MIEENLVLEVVEEVLGIAPSKPAPTWEELEAMQDKATELLMGKEWRHMTTTKTESAVIDAIYKAERQERNVANYDASLTFVAAKLQREARKMLDTIKAARA